MKTWKQQTWIERGRDPEDERREAYDYAVYRLAATNPSMILDDAADSVLREIADADEDVDGGEILRRVLAAETSTLG